MEEIVPNDGRAVYTLGHDPSVLASHGARTAESSAAYLLPHLTSGMRLLDVGFGPGTITLDLAARVAPGRVSGVENVEEPLVAAQAEAERRGDATTEFVHGDVYVLPFDDDSFDVVHAHQVLQHLEDPVAALREMHRVCRPGGILAARDADYAAMAWYPELPEMETWRSTYRAIARGNRAEPDAGRRLRAWARAAGLERVQHSASVWSYSSTEECRWWGEGQSARILGEAFTRQAAAHGVGADEVARIAEAWRRWGSDPDAWFLIPHGEVLATKPVRQVPGQGEPPAG